MTTTFSDLFDRAAQSIGNNWTNPTGNWYIPSSGLLRWTDWSTGLTWHDSGGAGDDYTVQRVTGGGSQHSGHYQSVTGRGSTDHNTYYEARLMWGAAGTGFARLLKIVGGSPTTLATDTSVNLTADAHTILLSMVGSTIKMKVDGVEKLSVTDTAIASGSQVGIIDDNNVAFYQISVSFQVDSVIVSSIALNPASLPYDGGNWRVYVTGTNVAWTYGTPGSPTFTLSAGTKIDQMVQSDRMAFIDLTTPTAAGTITVTDPSTTATAEITLTDPLAGPPPITDPYGLSTLIQWVVTTIIDHLAGLDLILANMGQGENNWYLQRILDELAITADQIPTDGNVKALVADLLTSTESPASLRYMVASAWTEASAAHTGVDVVTSNGTNSLADVLTAISGISSGQIDQADLDALKLALQGALGTTLDEIQANLNQIRTAYNLTLQDVRSVIPDQQTLLDAITAARGTDGGGTHPTIHDVRADVASSKLSLLAADGALAAALVALLLLGAGTTAAEAVTVVEGVVADGLSIADVVGLIANWLGNKPSNGQQAVTDLSTVLTDLANIAGEQDTDETTILAAIDGAVTDINSHTDTALSELQPPIAPPVWPGLSGVTLGDPVALDVGTHIDGPLHGVLLHITALQRTIPYQGLGSQHSYRNLGRFAFSTDNGYQEDWVGIFSDKALLMPRQMAIAGGCDLSFYCGVTGTATPFTIGTS